MYHYVRPFNPDFPYFKNLDIADFELQLDYFESEFGFVSKADFVAAFQEGSVPKGVVLTFDDGLKCHYRYALPALQKRGLWGIFYVPTQPYSEGKMIDVHRIHLILGKSDPKAVYEQLQTSLREDMIDQAKLAEFKQFTYRTQDNDNYTLGVKRFLNYFLSYTHREQIIDELIEEFVPNYQELFEDFYLKPAEIKEMQDAGMVIGSHTVNHPVMSRLNPAEQSAQIHDSFAFLEQTAGPLEPLTFCYPYGGFHSFTDQTEAILAEKGCLFSFNVEQRDIESGDLLNRPQALPRYDCNQFKYGQVRQRSFVG